MTKIRKLIKLAHQYELRTLRELEIFEFIADNIGGDYITMNMIEKKTGYSYTGVKKVVYKLGTGRESGYEGYGLIDYRDCSELPGRTKIIELTAKGKKFAAKLIKQRE